MINLRNLFREKNIRLVFRIGVVLKGVHAVIEIVGGLILFFVSTGYVIRFVFLITQDELSEDPGDLIATSLRTSVENLTLGGQHFAAFYLLIHGIINGFLVVNLFREKLWAYLLAIFVFGSFILYQIYRYAFSPSVGLLLLTVLDVVIIGLTWHEYRYRRGLIAER